MTDREATDSYSTILADGRRLCWTESGAPDGQPLLYCHGTPGSRLECLTAGKTPKELGLRVIAPDRPGYGGSDAQPGRSITSFSEDVAALLDHLHLEEIGVLGFSGGGPHAMACAIQLPRRVNRLGLTSSLAPFSDATMIGMPETLQSFWQLASHDLEAFSNVITEGLKATGGPYELLLNDALPEDQDVFSNALAGAYANNLSEGLRPGLEGMVADAQALTEPWGQALEAPRCPVHQWHGTLDLNAPIGMGRWLSAHLGSTHLTEWGDCAHFELFQRWDEVLAVFARPPN